MAPNESRAMLHEFVHQGDVRTMSNNEAACGVKHEIRCLSTFTRYEQVFPLCAARVYACSAVPFFGLLFRLDTSVMRYLPPRTRHIMCPGPRTLALVRGGRSIARLWMSLRATFKISSVSLVLIDQIRAFGSLALEGCQTGDGHI